MNKNNEIPNQFQRKSLEMVSSLLNVSSSVFCLVEGTTEIKRRQAVLFNANVDMEKAYSSRYRSLDPLNYERFNSKDISVLTLDSQISSQILKKTLFYQEFMLPYNHRYVADMFFRNNGNIVAVLSLLRSESIGDFTRDEVEMLKKIQPFIEYNLNKVYLPQKISTRQSIAEQYKFTRRELDVIELLFDGASNKQIATELHLSIATIKTHLNHIFVKASTKSRTELIAKINHKIYQD